MKLLTLGLPIVALTLGAGFARADEAVIRRVIRESRGIRGALLDERGSPEVRTVWVWAFESDPGSPGGLQPIPARHFRRGPDGALEGLCGPRVCVVMPDEIAVDVDEMDFRVVAASVPSPFPRDIQPGDDGAFAFAIDSPLTGATTAFYATTGLIDAAERWAGHLIDWGKEGQLKVLPYAFVCDFMNAYFDSRSGHVNLGALGRVESGSNRLEGFTGQPRGAPNHVADLKLDAALSRDMVAHEAAHAVFHELKPGARFGMAAAWNESFADTLSFLSALEDPDVIARVLAETGGDLRRENEVSRMSEHIGSFTKRYLDGEPGGDGERFLRSALADRTLSDAGLSRADTEIPGMGLIPGRDPHRVGQVLTRACYDFFAGVYEQALLAGKKPEGAVAEARDVVGAVVCRSTRFVPEHQISMRSVARAMVMVERDDLGERYQAELLVALRGRKLIKADESVAALVSHGEKRVVDYVLPPHVTAAHEVLDHLEVYEKRVLESARASTDEDVRWALVRHHPLAIDFERVPREELTIHSDVRSDSGMRVLRLRYPVKDPYDSERVHDGFILVVCDAAGRVMDVHSDLLVFPSW